jgi:Flp pilus assembly protein TadG
MSKARTSRFPCFRRNDDGAAALEFAFVAAPFLWVMMAIFEVGLVLLSEYAIETGTEEAGRMIRTGQVQTQGLSKQQFKDIVCAGIAAKMLDCKNKLYVDVRRFTSFAAVSLPPAVVNGQLDAQATTNSAFTPGAPLDVVVVRTFYDWKLFTPGISKLANVGSDRRILTASTAFRNEPYSN